MKKNNFFISIIAATMLLCGTGASAQSTASNWATFKQAWIDSQQPGITSTTITLTAGVTIDEDYDLTAVNPVTIDCNAFYLTVNSTSTVARTVTMGGNLTVIGTSQYMIRTNGSQLSTLTINGGNYSLTGANDVIQGTSKCNITINGGTFSTSTANTLIQLNNGSAVMTVNDGIFTVSGTGTNARGFQINSTGAKIIMNGGSLTVGAGGRGIHFAAPGTAIINGGSITMNGNNTGSLAVYVNHNTSSTLEVNGGTFNAGGGSFIGFGSATNSGVCIIRNAAITGTVYTKLSQTGNQLIYDFRGYIISANPAPTTILSATPVALSVPATITPDPADAANATIYYTTDGTVPTTASTAYTPGTSLDISVEPETTINAVTIKDGFVSDMYTFYYAGVPTNITDVSASRIFINGNTLYLPETGNVQIYSVSGQMLLNTVANSAAIDVSSLMQGIYIVKIGTSTYKVIK